MDFLGAPDLDVPMAEMTEVAMPKGSMNLGPPEASQQRRSVTGYDASFEVQLEGQGQSSPAHRPAMTMGPMSHQSDPGKRIPRRGEDASRPLGVSHDARELYTSNADSEPEGSGFIEVLANVGSIVLLIITLPIAIFFCFKVVQEYERAVIFRLGRLRRGGARGPGIFFILPCIDAYRCVDLRTVSFDVPPQEILTHDSVTVAVDAVVYYRVYNPTVAVSNVVDYSHSTRLLAATTLRNVLGTKNLAEILSERESISHTMQSSLDEATDPWGVKVERVEIKDVRLPVQLQRAMAAEAEAAREARAKVIAAEGEMKASRALKEASDVMIESPAALQLRYLQTLNTISAEKNSTIIFPIPIDILAPFISARQGKVDRDREAAAKSAKS